MCLNPRVITRPDGSRMEVGCGHCSQCLKAYQDGWTARLNEELKMWSPVAQDGVLSRPVIFFTFDYRPECIPCSYLVLTSLGFRVQRERPDCPVRPFWSQLSESPSNWLSRRRDILREWYRISSTIDDFPYFPEEVSLASDGLYFLSASGSWDFVPYHRFEPRWRRFSPTGLEYPVYDFRLPCDVTAQGVPIFALEFHTVEKKPISDVFKRARRALEYKYPEVFSRPVNPRINPFWTGLDGVDHEYPTCALTKTFKYFYTSEYGPTTFRPHGHGVCFGLTYDEFAETIAKDWESRYGHCEFSLLRPTGGAMMYLSKYCSKGNYEHPLCCRDFVYPSGKEFHSDSFELSLANFGCDCACVEPTFHLISKGLGACYAFRNEIMRYFGAQLSELLTPSGNVRYVCTDSGLFSSKPSLDLSRIFALVDGTSILDTVDVEDVGDGFRIRRFSSSDREHRFLVGESFIPHSAVVNCALEESMLNLKYNRSYVTFVDKNKAYPGSPVCLSCWHKLGMSCVGNPKTRTTSIALPRYYRQWLVSPLASCLRQSAATRLYPSVDALHAFALEHPEQKNKIQSLVEQILADREIRNMASAEKLRKSSERQYFRPGRSPRLM